MHENTKQNTGAVDRRAAEEAAKAEFENLERLRRVGRETQAPMESAGRVMGLQADVAMAMDIMAQVDLEERTGRAS